MYIARTGVAGSTLSVRFSVTIDEYVGEFQRIGELHIAGKVYALEGVGVSTYVLGAQYRKMTWVELGENPVFGGYFDSYRGLWIDGLNGNPDEGYYEEEVLQQTFFNYTVQFDYNLPVSAFKESNSGDKHSIVLNFEKENITVEHQESLIDSVVALTSAAKRRFENVNTVDKPAGN